MNELIEILKNQKNIETVLEQITDILKKTQNIVEMKCENAVFVGDLHGDFENIEKIYKYFFENFDAIIFLGDYVDRGEKQLQTLIFLYLLKINYPKNVTLLRGNHEIPSINYYYGFFNEVSEKLFTKIANTYGYLPLCAVINKSIFAVHGGIGNPIPTLSEIQSLDRFQTEPENDILLQLLWNDPHPYISAFKHNFSRGCFYYYGNEAIDNFLVKNNLEFLIRAHQYFFEGYKYFFNRKVLSIFSANNYGGRGNIGAIAKLKNNNIEIISLEQ